MQIGMEFKGLEKVQGLMQRLSNGQLRGALAKAIDDAAYQVQRGMKAEMARVFDRPTAYVLNSVQVNPRATPERLTATIWPTYMGGKGIDPQQILRAQGYGGRRRDKRSEVALRRIGVLPNGYQTAIPATPYPGSDDGRGNLRGPFLVQLLSYLQAFGEQGYRANMTAKRKKALQRGTAKQAGRRYFVAYGKLRGGRTGHFAPGIWAASGTDDVDVRPVLLFVRIGTYQPRLDMERISAQALAGEYLARRMRYRIRQAAGV